MNLGPTVAPDPLQPGFSIARFSSVPNWLSCLDLGRLRCWTRSLPRGPLGVLAISWLVRAERPGIGFDVNLFWVEQGDPKNWLESDSGHGNSGWYSPVRSTATDLTRIVGDPPIQPIGTWRLIGRWNHFTLQEISWLEGRRRCHVHTVACAAIASWRASLPAHPEEQNSLTPQSRAMANRRAESWGASAESMPAQTRAHHQHRQPSCDAPARTLLHQKVNFLLFHLSGCLDWTVVAPQLSFLSVGPDTGSLLAEITARLCVRSCGEQPSISGVAKRGARSGSADAPRDHGRGQWALEVAGEDGRRHREGEVPLDYRQQASQHHHRLSDQCQRFNDDRDRVSDGGRAQRGRRSCSGRQAADKRAPLERPAQRSRSRSLPRCSRLHRRLPSPSPHRQPAHLPGHAGAQLDERAVLREREQLSRRSSRTSRGEGETFEQPQESCRLASSNQLGRDGWRRD